LEVDDIITYLDMVTVEKTSLRPETDCKEIGPLQALYSRIWTKR